MRINCSRRFKNAYQVYEHNILGDPGADIGGEGKSKRAEKEGTKEK